MTNVSFNPFIIAFDTSLDFIIWMHQVQSYPVSIQVFANCIIRQNAFLSISANALQLLSRSPACKKRPPFSLSLCTPCADLVSLSTTQLPIAIPAVDRQLVSTFPLNSIPTPTPLLTSKDLKKDPCCSSSTQSPSFSATSWILFTASLSFSCSSVLLPCFLP